MSREKDAPRARGPEHTLYEVIRHVRPLHRYLAKAVEDRLEGTGITLGMRAVLERLCEHGPETVPQVARALGLGRQFIQRLVNAGLEEGLVRSQPNPAHRRSPLLEPTAAGREAFERIKEREEQVLREVASELPRGDIDACLRVVAHLTERFRGIAGPEADAESE
jgi:DNA-binding MarR family transcriptional regulator